MMVENRNADVVYVEFYPFTSNGNPHNGARKM
jgi:hypothetical protein